MICFTMVKEVSRGSPGKKLEGRTTVGENMGWVRKHREHCGHENRGEGSWPDRFVF